MNIRKPKTSHHKRSYTAVATYKHLHIEPINNLYNELHKRHKELSMHNNSTSVSVCKVDYYQEVIRYNLRRRYVRVNSLVGMSRINKILYNHPIHIVAVFKEYLILDDRSEFFHRFHGMNDAKYWISRAVEYYSKKRAPGPNYSVLREKHLLFKREKKARIKKLKNTPSPINGSTLFGSKFMESILNDDLNNSLTKLITIPQEPPANEREFKELLEELSTLVSTKHEKETSYTFPIKKALPKKTHRRFRAQHKKDKEVVKLSNEKRSSSLKRNGSSKNTLSKEGSLTRSMKKIPSKKTIIEKSTPYVKISLVSCNARYKPKYPKDSIKPRLISHTHAPSMNIKTLTKLDDKEEINLITIDKGRTSTLKLVFRKL